MTADETAKILTLLESEYPNSFSRMEEITKRLKLELWIREFAEDNFETVYTAVRLLMKSSREFAPNIGHIREKIRQLTQPEELTETEAWAMVSKACANGLYGYRKEFEKLPEEIQNAIGAPEQLKAWASMDAETVQSVVASNFKRAYRVQQSRKREMELIPEGMRTMLHSAAEGMKMLDG